MSINTVNPVFTNRMDEWKLYDDLFGGTQTMREASVTYLPQEINESDSAYQRRLNRTVLFNGFKRTVRTLASRPFIIPVQTQDEDDLEEQWIQNIDRTGTSLSDFSKQMMVQALKKNYCVVLVDHPAVDQELNYQDQINEDIRGYPIIIPNENLIDYELAQDAGEDRLIQFRYFEAYEVPVQDDPWTKEIKQQIKVWYEDRIETYRAPSDVAVVGTNIPIADYQLYETVENTLGMVPVVIFYQEKEAVFDSNNNLNDLAWLNINHWQSSSDQQNILHVARVPILHYKGWNDKDKITVGPNTMTKSTSTDAVLEYVEHSGAAIGSGATEISTIEDRMAVMGADMLVKRTASKTATEKLLNEEAETSELGQMVVSLEMKIRKIFEFMKQWQGEETEISISIFKDFAVRVDNGDLQVLYNSRISGEITQETYLQELKRRGVLDDTVNTEDEAEKAALDNQTNFSE